MYDSRIRFTSVFVLLACGWSSSNAQQVDQAERAAKRMFASADNDGDGQLTKAEFPKQFVRMFAQIDTNNDGKVSLQEDIAFRRKRMRQPSTVGKPTVSKGITVLRDLKYASVAGRDLFLDLYLPADNSKQRPVVMWVHGGGWLGGSKGNAGPARGMVDRGYVVVDVEYRLSGEAIFPAQIQDCKAAVRWLRRNAKKYDLNPNQIGAWGSSAGGHLVALLGTSGDVQEFETDANSGFSSRVDAVCDWFGPTDLLKMNEQAVPGSVLDHNSPGSPESKLVGGPIQSEPYKQLAVKANPITYVSKDDAPLLMVHGDNDKLVSHRQSQLLFKALQSKGVSAQLHIEPGAGHGLRGGKLSRSQLVQKSVDFFDVQFKMSDDKDTPE